MTPEEIHKKIFVCPSDLSFGLEGIKAICRLADKLPKGITVLETGTAYGRSAFTWALAADAKVKTIDYQNIQDIVMAFAKKFGLEDKITAIQGDSGRMECNEDYDVVWLDGCHDYDSVMRDLNNYDKHAKLLICGHDYGHPDFPGVKQAVDEFYKNNNIQTDGIFWYVWK